MKNYLIFSYGKYSIIFKYFYYNGMFQINSATFSEYIFCERHWMVGVEQ